MCVDTIWKQIYNCPNQTILKLIKMMMMMMVKCEAGGCLVFMVAALNCITNEIDGNQISF